MRVKSTKCTLPSLGERAIGHGYERHMLSSLVSAPNVYAFFVTSRHKLLQRFHLDPPISPILYIPPTNTPNQDWYDVSRSSSTRTTWTPGQPTPHPWKRTYSPLRSIPGGESWLRIRIDPAHTYATQGFGSTMATSTCVLLSHMGLASRRSLNARLDELYMTFKTWCLQNGKTTTLVGLSTQKLKMKSLLDLITFAVNVFHWF